MSNVRDRSDGHQASYLPEAEEVIETESWSKKHEDIESSAVDDDDDIIQEASSSGGGVSAYGMSAASGTNSAGSRRGLPKLREILRRQKQDSEVRSAEICQPL